MDSFFDQITNLLWPRLKTVMELHLRSIKQGTAVSLGYVPPNLHAHYVSRRFAEFTCSVLVILQKGNKAPPPPGSPRKNSITGHNTIMVANPPHHHLSEGRMQKAAPIKSSAGDMLLQDLNELLEEYIALLGRLSDEHTVNIKKIVFMINNLDQAVCIFQERRVAGGKELNRILELLMLQRELFVEEELLHGFSKMIAFVQQTEPSLATGSATDQTVNIQVVESLVREFASNWRSGMEAINRNVLSYFSNFRNGMEILKQCLTQRKLYTHIEFYILYYFS
jgi:hypothetical protein